MPLMSWLFLCFKRTGNGMCRKDIHFLQFSEYKMIVAMEGVGMELGDSYIRLV
jgi:hypothetical protein